LADTQLPICAHCTNAARTVETPRVKARVEKILVYRNGAGHIRLASWCHGTREEIGLSDVWAGFDESHLARLEVFKNESERA